ncbi:hypothetical protein [Undibacterium sp. Xuan67W]|uniref:hypothetical protein n=1 Tax=Undibacterium sp. Xuan67W TaxID=3413057 RepID=UPI003BF0364C
MPFPISEHTREAVQHHFRRKSLVWNEAYFVNVLQTSDKKHDIYWAVLALRDCGTKASIPALKDKLQYPMQDVKCCAILTIAHIAGSDETLLFAEAISGTEYRDKGYAMWAIRDAADGRAVESVLAYFKKNRSRLKSGNLTSAALIDGLDYLEKYRPSNAEVARFFEEVDGFWLNLPEGNRIEISKRVPFFAGHPIGAVVSG